MSLKETFDVQTEKPVLDFVDSLEENLKEENVGRVIRKKDTKIVVTGIASRAKQHKAGIGTLEIEECGEENLMVELDASVTVTGCSCIIMLIMLSLGIIPGLIYMMMINSNEDKAERIMSKEAKRKIRRAIQKSK